MWIAVTGNIGSGKSTLARMLEQRGAQRVDADVLSRQMVEESVPLRRELAEAFGVDILNEDGQLNRRELAIRALANRSGWQRIESIVRPHLEPVLLAHLSGAESAASDMGGVVVLDAPLVFEWGIEDWFERVFLVVADPVAATKRITESRQISLAEIHQRQAAQLSATEHWTDRSTVCEIVDNNGSLNDLRTMADEIWSTLVSPRTAG